MTFPKSVIITAGASGIGLATAQRFLAAEYRVAICDVSEAAIEQAVARNPGIIARKVDISDEAQAGAFWHEMEILLDGVGALVNNAGIAGAQASIEDTSASAWQRSFEVNVHGAFYMIKAAVPSMKKRRAGAIVNISTGSVITLPRGRADYISSKWAVEGLTRAAARELGPDGIRVNAIRPGFVDSERMRAILTEKGNAEGKTLAEIEAVFLKYISMQTKVQPEEIGDMAVFLCSQAACHVSGQLLSVDGNIEWED